MKKVAFILMCMLLSVLCGAGSSSSNPIASGGEAPPPPPVEVSFSEYRGQIYISWPVITGLPNIIPIVYQVVVTGAINNTFSSTTSSASIGYLEKGETVSVTIYSGGYVAHTGSYTRSGISTTQNCQKQMPSVNGTYEHLHHKDSIDEWKITISLQSIQYPTDFFQNFTVFVYSGPDDRSPIYTTQSIQLGQSLVFSGPINNGSYSVSQLCIQLIPTACDLKYAEGRGYFPLGEGKIEPISFTYINNIH